MGRYEHCFVFVIGIQVIFGVILSSIEEVEQDDAGCGVHNLIDVRERDGIFRAVLVKVGVIDTHP
jgi:hypothetical protein